MTLNHKRYTCPEGHMFAAPLEGEDRFGEGQPCPSTAFLGWDEQGNAKRLRCNRPLRLFVSPDATVRDAEWRRIRDEMRAAPRVPYGAGAAAIDARWHTTECNGCNSNEAVIQLEIGRNSTSCLISRLCKDCARELAHDLAQLLEEA